jgi:hypothetical protein
MESKSLLIAGVIVAAIGVNGFASAAVTHHSKRPQAGGDRTQSPSSLRRAFP